MPRRVTPHDVPTVMMGDRARWQIIWWSKKHDALIEQDFENDLPGALELYTKLNAAGKKLVTLRSCNVGFPPPERLRPHTARIKVRVRARDGKKRIEYRYKEVVPMAELNQKGVLWCPYCIKLRRFRHQDGFNYEDRFVGIPGQHCPVCGISTRNHLVRKHNPAFTLAPTSTANKRSRRARKR